MAYLGCLCVNTERSPLFMAPFVRNRDTSVICNLEPEVVSVGDGCEVNNTAEKLVDEIFSFDRVDGIIEKQAEELGGSCSVWIKWL